MAPRSAGSTERRRWDPSRANLHRSRLTLSAVKVGTILLVWLLGGAVAGAQPQVDLSHWRFFSSAEGLRESWVEDISPGANGRYWITHGSVDAMSVFDGFTFERLPTPGANLTVREDPDGRPWALHRSPAFAVDGLQVF